MLGRIVKRDPLIEVRVTFRDLPRLHLRKFP
jgi:hypothetical protein